MTVCSVVPAHMPLCIEARKLVIGKSVCCQGNLSRLLATFVSSCQDLVSRCGAPKPAGPINAIVLYEAVDVSARIASRLSKCQR